MVKISIYENIDVVEFSSMSDYDIGFLLGEVARLGLEHTIYAAHRILRIYEPIESIELLDVPRGTPADDTIGWLDDDSGMNRVPPLVKPWTDEW